MSNLTPFNSAFALGQVGPSTLSDGANGPVRQSKDGASVVQQAHGDYYEAVARGNCYGVANQVGVTSQAGLSATTPVLTLANPTGSGVNAVIIYAGAIFTVVFATVGAVWVAVNTDLSAAAVTGTLTTSHRNLLLGSGKSPAVKSFLAATLPAAPVAIAQLGAGLTGAVNLLPVSVVLGKFFNGSLILAPGASLSIQTGVASGASGTFCEYIWEEVAIQA